MTSGTGRPRSDGNAMGAGRRADVLRVLRSAPGPWTIAEVAERLGVHANTVRFHLESLEAAGRVERVRSGHRAPGRPPLLFRAARTMDPAGPRQYQALAEALVQGLASQQDTRARALEAGRAWGRRQATRSVRGADDPAAVKDGAGDRVPRLIGLLDEFGFAPEQGAGDESGQIGLRHCPFLELAEARADVVCPVHLGLMQGAMEAWQSPVTVERLDAFVEPDLCVAQLGVAAGT